MHFLIAQTHVTLPTDAKTILDVENIQHLLQFWKDKVFFFFFLSYQSTLLSICLFLINVRRFCVGSSAQLSGVIRTAKNSNPGNFIFHNILALADSVESQQ